MLEPLMNWVEVRKKKFNTLEDFPNVVGPNLILEETRLWVRCHANFLTQKGEDG